MTGQRETQSRRKVTMRAIATKKDGERKRRNSDRKGKSEVGMQMSISQKVNVMRKTQATTSQKEEGEKESHPQPGEKTQLTTNGQTHESLCSGGR